MATGEKISKGTARKWVNNYKEKHEQDKNYLCSMLFNKQIVLSLLNERGCESLRVYNALDEEGKEHFILVGVDASGKNILPETDEYTGNTADVDANGGAFLVNNGSPCPGLPGCPPSGL